MENYYRRYINFGWTQNSNQNRPHATLKITSLTISRTKITENVFSDHVIFTQKSKVKSP
jgi:hypothetical protein